MPTDQELFDAKLGKVSAETDAKFAQLIGKIDRLSDNISAMKDEEVATRAAVKDEGTLTRYTIIGLVIAGLAALWVTQSNMLASFTAGIAVHEAQKPSTPITPPK